MDGHTSTVPFACEPTCSHKDNVSIKASVYDIDYQMHAEARSRVVQCFRDEDTVPPKSVLFFQGGTSKTRDETDTEHIYNNNNI